MGRHASTAAGSARNAGNAASCKPTLYAATLARHAGRLAIHSPNGISFITTRSGSARSKRHAKSDHAGCSGVRFVGSWQTASFTDQTSPDAHARLGREIETLPRSYIERVVPRIEVAHGS